MLTYFLFFVLGQPIPLASWLLCSLFFEDLYSLNSHKVHANHGLSCSVLSAHPACDGRKLEPRECVIGVAHKVRGSHTLLLPEGEECRGQEGMVDTGNPQCVRCVPQTDEVGVPLSDSIIYRLRFLWFYTHAGYNTHTHTHTHTHTYTHTHTHTHTHTNTHTHTHTQIQTYTSTQTRKLLYRPTHT